VDGVFNAPAPHAGARVLIATYAFAFQIYCDFDGYSNIAVGSARLLGIHRPHHVWTEHPVHPATRPFAA